MADRIDTTENPVWVLQYAGSPTGPCFPWCCRERMQSTHEPASDGTEWAPGDEPHWMCHGCGNTYALRHPATQDPPTTPHKRSEIA